MEVGAVSALLNALNQGNASLTGGIVNLSQQQAAQTTQLLLQMYALKMSNDMQQAAALALIQSVMGIGQNINYLA